MKEQHIARLETQLEKLVEGVFAHLFGRRLRAHDIALQIARSMEANIETADDDSARAFAPDRYVIRVHPTIHHQILSRYPTLIPTLTEQIVELAANVGYQLRAEPMVILVSDQAIATGQLTITANHTQKKGGTTQVMQPVRQPAANTPPSSAQLLIKGVRSYPLGEAFINIGRSPDNHIVMDDAYASRYHAQIRLRFGHYTIFDADSLGGTFVNEVRIKEHRLQPGDVIRIGNTAMVYMEDDPLNDSPTGSMNSL